MDDFLDDSYGGIGYFRQYMDLYEEVEQEIDTLREYEIKAAEAEREYRMLLSAMTAQYRTSGTPVTVISDLCRGEERIADAKLRWKSAEANAKASSHVIFLKKDKMAMLQEVAKHELYRPSNA